MPTVQKNVQISAEEQAMNDRMVQIVRNAVERAKIKGAPVALYDPIKKQAYLVYPNGEKRYAE